jgi:ketosteroid isomerase-like protein
MKKTIYCSFVLIACLSSGLFAQQASSDEATIRKIVERFTPMWTAQEGVAIFDEIASDSHFMMFSANSVLSKDEFMQQLAAIIQNNPPIRHAHNIKNIVVSGNIAFEYGTNEVVRQNGQTIKGKPVNVFYREGDSWKLVMSMPGAELEKLFEE